jgi:hypothetical protein
VTRRATTRAGSAATRWGGRPPGTHRRAPR